MALLAAGCASARMEDPWVQGEDGAGLPADLKTGPRKDGGQKPKDLPRPKLDKIKPAPDKPKPDMAVGVKKDKGVTPKPDKALPKPDKSLPKPDMSLPKPDTVPTCPRVTYKTTFEGNKGAFKSWGDWQWGVYGFKAGSTCDSTSHVPPPAAHSGSKMWGTVLNSCHNPSANATAACNNSNPKNNSILRLEVKVPAGCTKAFLEWWEYNDYFLNFDWAEVRIGTQVIHQNCDSSKVPQRQWIKRVVEISQYQGKSIGLEFHFLATGVINYSGWYIDDVAIRVQ